MAVARVRRLFKHPPKSYRPMVRWWWPGGDVNDAELLREIGLLDEAGFGGAEIQPFRIGLKPDLPADVQARVDDYLTQSFWEHVGAAAKEAGRRGMWIDLTFGSGWPFGGGDNITPELASMELRFTHITIEGPQHFHQKLELPVTPPGIGTLVKRAINRGEVTRPGWDQRLANLRKLVAVIAVRGSQPDLKPGPQGLLPVQAEIVTRSGRLEVGSTVVLTDRVGSDGTLDWDVPDGQWQLFTFAQSPADLWVLGGVGAWPQLVLDHMKLRALESHIQHVGGAAKLYAGSYFGNGIRAVFCDSLEVVAYLHWTDGFLDAFRRLRGYDLTPYLPLIKQPGFNEPYGAWDSLPMYDAPEIGERVRHDYWQTVSDLMIANFYRPFNAWARRNRVLGRVQAHGAQADVLRIYGESDIPETEQLYAGGQEDFLRMAPSAAHVYGHRIASSESFVKAGNPYRTTPELIKVWSDQLLTSGINQIIYHGYPYDYMDWAEPGWHPFSAPGAFSSHMNQHNTFWDCLRPINEYITRLQYLSRSGRNVAPVAIYRSALSYESKSAADPEINRRLIEAGYNFDQIGTDGLMKSRVERGEMVSPGGARYRGLILVNERAIPVAAAERIARFRRQGLRVAFIGTVPGGEAGLKDWQPRSRRIRQLFHGVAPKSTAQEAVSEMSREIRPSLLFHASSRFNESSGLGAGSESVPFFHKKLGASDVYFLSNPAPQSKRLKVTFPVRGSPQKWDPWTGDIRPDLAFTKGKDGVEMQIEFPPYGSNLIVFDPDDHHGSRLGSPPVDTPHPPSLSLSGDGKKWSLRAGEVRLELAELLDWLQLDGLKSYSGKAEYEVRFDLSGDWLNQAGHVELDLGEVHDVAEVTLNGRPGPLMLLRPYRADVRGLLKPGENVLNVRVTNSWTNRLLSQGVSLANPAGPKPEPEPSGLIGPVRLVPLH